MDDDRIAALVDALRLQALWAEFPEEVRAAAAVAETQRGTIEQIADVAVEPWSPVSLR